MGRLLYSPMDDRRVPKLARPARSVTRATTAAKHPLPLLRLGRRPCGGKPSADSKKLSMSQNE